MKRFGGNKAQQEGQESTSRRTRFLENLLVHRSSDFQRYYEQQSVLVDQLWKKHETLSQLITGAEVISDLDVRNNYFPLYKPENSINNY